MKQLRRLLSLTCAFALVVSISLPTWLTSTRAASEGEAYALRGGTVVTVTGAAIPKGTVIVRNGLIEAVGADVAIPADAKVIDATGMTIYPGFFDAMTGLGIKQTAPAGGPGGGRGGAPADPMQAFLAQMAAPPSAAGLLPETNVVDQLEVGAETFDQQRSAGITTALTAPRTGVYQGQSALINLGSEAAEKLILKSQVSLNVGFSGNRGGYPGSLMGVFAFLRQSLLDAQHYREEWSRYTQSPRGAQRPQVNKSLAALQPVINGTMPVVFQVTTVREIKRAVALAEEFKLKFMLAGATQSYELADMLKAKNATVLLSLSYPQRPQLDDPEEEPLRMLRDRAEAPKAAATLHKAGVKFAFTSGALTRSQDFIANAIRAIEAGLPADAALKAMTINAAEIFGVQEQLGSIEKGKIANLVLASGDIFKKDTKVKHVFVDGKLFDIKAVEAPRGMGGPGGRGGGRPGGPPAGGGDMSAALATGTWAITVNSPMGTQPGTLKLTQNGASLTGEITTSFGTAPITGGTISGNEIRYSYSLNVQGQTINVTATGKIEGGSLTGNMTAMDQTFDYNGKKNPNEE